MKNRKKLVYLMTAMFVLVIVVAELALMKQERFSFAVEVTAGDGTETLKPWYQEEEGCYYVFLPSYADPNQTEMVINVLNPSWIQGQKVNEGTVCGEFDFNKVLELRYKMWGETHIETIFFCQSGNVPTLYIDTASGAMDYIHEYKGNAEPGRFRLYTTDGERNCDVRIDAISGRGNSTWGPRKKPYSVELTQSTDLLGMGSARKWILLANGYDSTNLGNKMCLDFAAAAGCAYTPECQWVDLYLNGSYAGPYVLSERNEVDPQRVDIPKESSFLISTTSQWQAEDRDYSTFSSDSGILMRIRHAGIPVQRMQEIWNCVENAINAPDGVDPISGKNWQDLLDLDSWAQQFLLWEFFADFDAGTLSKFFYYDSNSDKVFAGPLWDMDNIMYQHSWYTPNILAVQQKRGNLFSTLYQKEPFQQRVKELYRQVYHPLLEELAENGMQTYLFQSLAAAKRNKVRWDSKDPADAIQEWTQYLKMRIAFLDDYWEAEEEYCIIELKCTDDDQWRYFGVRRGEPADFLPADRQWVEYETGEPFDRTAPVTRDWIIQQAEDREE